MSLSSPHVDENAGGCGGMMAAARAGRRGEGDGGRIKAYTDTSSSLTPSSTSCCGRDSLSSSHDNNNNNKTTWLNGDHGPRNVQNKQKKKNGREEIARDRASVIARKSVGCHRKNNRLISTTTTTTTSSSSFSKAEPPKSLYHRKEIDAGKVTCNSDEDDDDDDDDDDDEDLTEYYSNSDGDDDSVDSVDSPTVLCWEGNKVWSSTENNHQSINQPSFVDDQRTTTNEMTNKQDDDKPQQQKQRVMMPFPTNNPIFSLFGSKIGLPLSYGILRDPKAYPSNNSNDIYWHYNPGPYSFSRKIFVGGLPIDIEDTEIHAQFGRFGQVFIDWPYQSNPLRGTYPNKSTGGYVFLVFKEERSVHGLIEHCHKEDHETFYLCVTSPSMRKKPAHVRPWPLADSDFIVNQNQPLDPRNTVFVGAVPRPMKAVELAHAINNLYGNVAYAGIDTDPEHHYPKGSGRVVFSNETSYLEAISQRYVQIHLGQYNKRVEVRPYVMEGQTCQRCHGTRRGALNAPFFCPSVPCLSYYCEECWQERHNSVTSSLSSASNLAHHKPAVRDSFRPAATAAATAAAAAATATTSNHQHQSKDMENSRQAHQDPPKLSTTAPAPLLITSSSASFGPLPSQPGHHQHNHQHNQQLKQHLNSNVDNDDYPRRPSVGYPYYHNRSRNDRSHHYHHHHQNYRSGHPQQHQNRYNNYQQHQQQNQNHPSRHHGPRYHGPPQNDKKYNHPDQQQQQRYHQSSTMNNHDTDSAAAAKPNYHSIVSY